MAFTLAQLDAIESGIASGSTSVSYEGKSVTYRSIEDMLLIRGILMRALGVAPNASSTQLASHDRGFRGGQFNDDELVSGF